MMMRRTLIALVAALGALALPAEAPAQDGGLIVIPMDTGRIDPVASAAATADFVRRARAAQVVPAISGAAPAEPPARPLAPLRPVLSAAHRVGETHDRLRLQGENDLAEFSVHVAEPAAGMTLQVVSQSTINVLPERSALRIFVNGNLVGTATPEHFSAPAPVSFALPAGLLVPGRNLVRIEAAQFHRIFCGPEASFALWTDIDISRSGVFVAEGDSRLQATTIEGFLASVAADAARGLAVEIRDAAALSEDHRRWLDGLSARISANLGGVPVAWSRSDAWTVHEGLPASARITVLPGAQSDIRLVHGGDGALVLLVTTGPTPLPAVRDLVPEPAEDRRLAAARGFASLPMVEPGREVALSEIGMQGIRIEQHYYRRDFGFRLPEDWLVLTAEKARIRMDYAFAEGLPEGAMLLIQINGETVRLLPLWSGGGRAITRFPVDFEARLLRGGANRISFELLIPGTPPDLPCAGFGGPVLELRDSITIHVPESPRMWMPDLARPFAYMTPDSLRQDAPGRAAFGPDELMMLRAALVQGMPDTPVATAPRLHLVSLDQIGTVPFGQVTPDRRLLEDVLLRQGRPEAAPAASGNSATRGADLSVDPFGFDPVIRARAESDWGWFEPVRDLGRQAFDWARRIVDPRPTAQLELWLAQQGGMAMLVQLDYDRPGDVWLIRGRDADAGAISAAIARAQLSGIGPLGQVAVLDRDGNWHSWSSPDRRPVLREAVSIGNVRSVLGNFASAAPLWFALAMIALVLAAAAAALALTVSTRGRR
jgi:cellulose synthase operon protein B